MLTNVSNSFIHIIVQIFGRSELTIMIIVDHIPFIRNKMTRLRTALLMDLTNSLARCHTMLIEVKDLDRSGNIRFSLSKSHAAWCGETGFYARLQLFNRHCNYYMIVEGPVEKSVGDETGTDYAWDPTASRDFIMRCHVVQYFPDIQKNPNALKTRLLRMVSWLLTDNRPQINRVIFTN